jgi:glycerol-3-phosphate acyltransferase PlsY
MIYFLELLFLIATYLVASIPFGYLLAKKYSGKDVRSAGSGNIGATNVVRVAGKKLGLITLLLDALKGMLMVILGRFIFVDADHLHLFLVIVAAIAVVGHIFPIYLNFKGGKGVATTIAVLLALDTIAGSVMIITWLTVFFIFRVSAISSLTAITMAMLFSIIFHAPPSQAWLCVFLFILIAYRHKDNIKRLIEGKEHKF